LVLCNSDSSGLAKQSYIVRNKLVTKCLEESCAGMESVNKQIKLRNMDMILAFGVLEVFQGRLPNGSFERTD
jgi:hypothetical protein